jgi:cytoskeletal protein RodZ
MFGLGNRNDQQSAQLPYEVYETVQESTYRRRRWVIRLVAALLVVTILVFAGLGLKKLINNLSSDDKTPQQTQAESQSGSWQGSSNNDVVPSDPVTQAPQQNTPATTGSTPVTTPQSSADNNTTVRKPQ